MGDWRRRWFRHGCKQKVQIVLLFHLNFQRYESQDLDVNFLHSSETLSLSFIIVCLGETSTSFFQVWLKILTWIFSFAKLTFKPDKRMLSWPGQLIHKLTMTVNSVWWTNTSQASRFFNLKSCKNQTFPMRFCCYCYYCFHSRGTKQVKQGRRPNLK